MADLSLNLVFIVVDWDEHKPTGQRDGLSAPQVPRIGEAVVLEDDDGVRLHPMRVVDVVWINNGSVEVMLADPRTAKRHQPRAKCNGCGQFLSDEDLADDETRCAACR